MSASRRPLLRRHSEERSPAGTRMSMTFSFKDRLYPPPGLRVLVTAGASGIGAAIASAFAEADAKIHICDINDAALAASQTAFPRYHASTADVADETQVVSLFETQRKKF